MGGLVTFSSGILTCMCPPCGFSSIITEVGCNSYSDWAAVDEVTCQRPLG